MNKVIRWKQRYENLKKSYTFFTTEIARTSFSPLETAGILKTFEFTFELFWKTLKDYAESKGQEEKYPRDVIKSAFQKGLIVDGHLWIEMLDIRNEIAHTYDHDKATKILNKIKGNYTPAMKQVFEALTSLLNES